MPHVVTQSCCNDASCVYACPVNCIHPTPDEPDFGIAEMLHIDPVACVDCGACVSACPTGAIVRDTKLEPGQQVFLDINADFYGRDGGRQYDLLARPVPAPHAERSLRVAIVGSGPAAMYAADEALLAGATVDMYERLSAPYGLVRYGVAPDHVETKGVMALFDTIAAQDGFRLHLNVEVGKDVSLAALQARHDAVIYAVGAATDRKLEIPGVGLPGVDSATDFVAWYNGHPDLAGRDFDLTARHAVIIGNGNVALDVARMLTTVLHSKIEEVTIVARGGPERSAFTVGEFAGLLAVPDIDVVVDAELPDLTTPKLRLLRQAQERPVGDRKRVVFRYGLNPTIIHGGERVTAVEFADGTTLDAGLVLTAIGYHGVPITDLPFDEAAGIVPHDAGRVRPGVYVTGWIKRGARGYIGTNKSCAQETLRTLVADLRR